MRVEELERELRAERQEPSQDFARRLDEWAEAGFPRDRGLGPRLADRKGPFGRAWDRLTSTPPRRILMPAGAVATVVVVAGVAISRQEATDTGLTARGPEATQPTTSVPSAAEDQAQAPSVQSSTSTTELAPEAAAPPQAAGAAGGGAFAQGDNGRVVIQSAQLTLGAPADEVQDVADDVVDVTDRYHGVVLDSQVTSDQSGARASFQLQIPSRQLEAALSDLSGLADVVSRSETGEDITGRAVKARKQLADTLDQVHDARIALIRADTREERLVLKSRISSLEATADAYETQLNQVERQGRFAKVSVDVTSTAGSSSADDGNWGLDDALDDAGDVLETIGGIALVSLAILVPVSLVAALIAFAISRSRRRSREAALD